MEHRALVRQLGLTGLPDPDAPTSAVADGSARFGSSRRERVSSRGAAAGLTLTLHLTDPDVLAELRGRPDGPERDRFAAAALRIGVLALRSASGSLDADAVREAGHELLADLRETLAARAAELTGEMGRTLTQYFDPMSGLVAQKLDGLVRDGGDLERLLRSHVGDESTLARTLSVHLGQESALFRMLSPSEAEGLRAQFEKGLASTLREQSAEVLREFSLDHRDSALSRLVRELRVQQGEMSAELKGQVDAVVREFSLDKPDSVMSRLSGLLSRTQEQIGKNLSLDDEKSALARLRRELMGKVEELTRHNTAFHSDVRATLAALDARNQEMARSTRHGATFEDALGGLLAAEAQRVGDIHQAVGLTTGAIKNCKVGDHLVVMGPDSSAPNASIVFEAKEDRTCDLRAALAESDRARKNRQAQIGVFVFSARSAPADLQPLARYGDDIVVVWDAEDEQSDVYVRCAYTMARCLTARVAGATAQSAEIVLEIELATRAIEKQVQFLDEVHRLAGTIKNNGERIVARMERMRDELTRELERLDAQSRALRADSAAR